MNKTYNVSGFNIKDVDKKKIIRWVLIAAAAVILIALVSTSFYTVSDKEVAVVTRKRITSRSTRSRVSRSATVPIPTPAFSKKV